MGDIQDPMRDESWVREAERGRNPSQEPEREDGATRVMRKWKTKKMIWQDDVDETADVISELAHGSAGV